MHLLLVRAPATLSQSQSSKQEGFFHVSVNVYRERTSSIPSLADRTSASHSTGCERARELHVIVHDALAHVFSCSPCYENDKQHEE
ncbi:hypothetical protein PR048_026991 [Dryococelus australis]|uniref:Uncharacterized protein n=1 Tax=Dryococelus australis TaxID=614101 RepID=A0ABQ9GMT9_9NEOP|nr:hypothetical protein PR048_026991 [Dryococelus australis]